MTLRSILSCAGAVAALFLGIPTILADAVTSEGFRYPDVTLTGYKDGAIIADAAGQQKSYKLSTLDLIEADGESALNDAEQARKKSDWAKAAELYSQAMHPARRELKAVVEARAIPAFDNTGKYLDAIKAFMDLYAMSPTAATYALRPHKLPDAGSQMLAESASLINARIRDQQFNDPQAQINLKTMLLEIYTQNKDPKSAEIARELNPGSAPPGGGVQVTVTIAAKAPGANLSTIDDALASKKYDEVIKAGDAMLPAADVETAVHIYMAEAQAYAGLNKPEDAQAAYLRVAIHYPGHSQAPEALLQAAQLEKTSNPEGSQRLLKEIISKYPNSPAADKARSNS